MSQPVEVKNADVPVCNSEHREATKCENCSVEVDEKVAYFCRINKAKFDGKILCRNCQQTSTTKRLVTTSNPTVCVSCNTAVDSKVVYFCNLNKKKFDGKILCRNCQQTSA